MSEKPAGVARVLRRGLFAKSGAVAAETPPLQPQRVLQWGLSAGAVLLLLAAFLAQGVLSLREKAPTFDEVTYFGLGQYILHTGRFDVPGAGTHPPLSFYLSSLPLLGRKLAEDLWRYPDSVRRRVGRNFTLAHDARRGQRLFARDHPPDRLLNRCRTVTLATALLLGPMIFFWARRVFGIGGAFLSLFLFSFDPNLVAHARLITPDFLLTVTFFAAAFFAASGRDRSRWNRSVCSGLFAGLALLAKHSALLLLPALAAICLARGGRRGAGRALIETALILAVAAVVLCLGYQLEPWHYLESLRLQLEHAGAGHPAFLWGKVSDRGWWYYQLFGFALKTPLPLFFLLFLSCFIALGRMAGRRHGPALLCPPLLVLIAFSVISGPDIGLRYILPAYPFLIVIAGGAALAWRRGAAGKIALALLLCWHLVGTLRIFPDYLAFFNEVGGGPRQGYRFLVDSNLDWGQDLKRLKAYLDAHGIERIHLSYFGAADPAMYGIKYDTLPGYFLGRNLPAPTQWRGVFAVSATNLAGVYLHDRDTFARLRERAPDATIGYSIFIYDLDR